MNESTRRTFVKSIGVSAAGLALAARQSRAADGDKLVLGIIGPGGMGSNHLRLLVERSDVRIAWVCDVDRDRLATAAKTVTDKTGHAPQVTGDLRQVLDDRAVDAVFVATPDHWHAPAAILALDAGKHVYVEKPCCHNIREGRLMIEAVRRSGKTLQVGTQSRSTPTVQEAIQRLRDGDIGDVLVAKAWTRISQMSSRSSVCDLRYTLEKQGYSANSCHADGGTQWVTAKRAIYGSVSTAG